MVKRPKARRFVVEKYACCCGNGDTIYSIILYHIIVYHGVATPIYTIEEYTKLQRGLPSMCSHIAVRRTNTKNMVITAVALAPAGPTSGKNGGARYG